MLMKQVFMLLILTLFLVGCGAIDTEPVRQVHDPSLKDYHIVQYISASRSGPAKMMRMDNNGDILLSCLEGCTRETLDSLGIPWTDSQLELLEVYRLLDRKGKRYTTSFPILDPEKTKRLRSEMRAIADKVTPVISPDMQEMVSALHDQGWAENTYSIIFAYILDGRVWDRFDDRGLMTSTSIDVDHPYWAGETWASYPKREFSSGRNSFWHYDIAFVSNWSADIMPKLREIWADRELFYSFMEEYSSTGVVSDPEIIAKYAEFGILDQTGKPIIPVINANSVDPIHSRAVLISEKLADAILSEMDLADLSREYGFTAESQALIVAYHELMWDLTDNLVASGILSLPTAFSDPETASLRDLSDLTYIIIPDE